MKIIRKPIKPLDVPQSFHDSMKKAGIDASLKLTRKEIIDPTKEIADQLKISSKKLINYLKRIAYFKNQPLNKNRGA